MAYTIVAANASIRPMQVYAPLQGYKLVSILEIQVVQ
jgi:hypothetical protein